MKYIAFILLLLMVRVGVAQPPMVVEVHLKSSELQGSKMELEVNVIFDRGLEITEAKVAANTVATLMYTAGLEENQKVDLSKTEVLNFSFNGKDATLKITNVPKRKILVTDFTVRTLQAAEKNEGEKNDNLKEYILSFSSRPKDDDKAGSAKLLKDAENFITTWEAGGVGQPRKVKIPGAGTAQKVKIKAITEAKVDLEKEDPVKTKDPVKKDDPLKLVYIVKWL